MGKEHKWLSELKNMAQGLKENWIEITEDMRSSKGQIETVTGNLDNRLDHVEENPAKLEDRSFEFLVPRQKEKKKKRS